MPQATPLARRLAQSRGIALETLTPSGAHGKVRADDVLDALEGKNTGKSASTTENTKKATRKNTRETTRIFASPRARARAKAEGIDLASLQTQGSGPQGRIVQRDLEQHLQKGGAHARSSNNSFTDLPLETPFELSPHTTMREVIAQRLTLSKSTIPHFSLTVACKLDALLALRAQINTTLHDTHQATQQAEDSSSNDSSGEESKPFEVSLNDLLVKSLALAYKACPQANVAWTEQGMKQFRRVDVSVAVSVPGGLVTPIVRDAAAKPLLMLAHELHALIKRARQGLLQPQDYTGGTVSISNLGMVGVHAFQAIINPPQSAILALGAGEKVLTRDRDHAIVSETRMFATLSADHRAIDGMAAAQVSNKFRHIVEHPAALLLDHS